MGAGKTIKIYVIHGSRKYRWGKHVKEIHDVYRRFTPNCSGRWRNLELCDSFEDADIYIAFRCYGYKSIAEKCPPHSVIDLMREPRRWIPKKKFGKEQLTCRWVTEGPNPQVWWWVKKGYSELAGKPFPKKTKLVSYVTTGKFKLPGRKLRLSFTKKFSDKHPGVLDLYGRNKGQFDLRTIRDYKGPIDDKWTGLAPYRYSFAFENVSEKNYFSEKLSDAILSGCMPIYWGCTNLGKFFPKGSYVYLDISRKDAVDRAMKIIRSNYRERNLKALRRAKNLILNKYQFWPYIHKLINDLMRKPIIQ